MIYDLQKASVLKRISASLLDVILALIIATGFFFVLSSIFNYDSKFDEYNDSIDVYNEYIEQYNVLVGDKYMKDITDTSVLTQEQKVEYYKIKTMMEKDPVAIELYRTAVTNRATLINLALFFVTVGVLLAILVIEFFVPLIIGNGQTLGKKMFGICLMMDNGVKVKTLPLFVRTLFGKFTVETMIPVYAAVYLIFGQVNILMLFLVFAMILAELLMIIINPRNALLHDAMSYIVVVDKNSQMIFETEEELIKYKEDRAKKDVSSKKTFLI